MVSAVTGELRAAMGCLALGSLRPEALEHCKEVLRLSRVAHDVSQPLGASLVGRAPREMGQVIAWDASMAALRRALDACVEVANLVEIVVGEA